jgi:hypothetical protein
MNRTYHLFIALSLLLLLCGCPYGYKYNHGVFPDDPVNIMFLNSVYNDYNLAAPYIEGERYLYFSSDRDSYGQDFDIIGKDFRVSWDRVEGKLQIDDKKHSWIDYSYSDSLFRLMNTSANEFGPYSLSFISWRSLDPIYTDLVIYSNDVSGDLDLKFVFFQGLGEEPDPLEGNYSGPEEITFLNSTSDDAYLTFWGEDFIIYDERVVVNVIQELYFCSDRNGNFDIFKTDVPPEADIVEFLMSDEAVQVSSTDVLNSDYQDKCPFINGRLLVFASDRPGGFGGYDLYYSIREASTWSSPKNLGDKINTEFNEFRPVALLYFEFENNLLMFSSDRPGGKGGYDLYYAGIPSMID